MLKVNNKETKTSFYCIYCEISTCLTSFSTFSAVKFEQVNVWCVRLYKFIDAEITYCWNYRQMCKGFSEIVAHKKSSCF